MNGRAKKATKRQWHQKQEWGATPLHRPTSSDRNQSHQPPILPHRARGTEGNPRIPMVCRHATKNRLETRMDRSHPTPSNTACQKCKESHLCAPTKECPSTKGDGQLFPRKNHLSS